MLTLMLSVLGSIIKYSIIPVTLICLQIWLAKNKQLKWTLFLISTVAAIFVANYIFLTHTASAGELKKLSMDLKNDNQAEMYVIENENEEIIVYSSLKIKNNEGMIIDEEDVILQSHYQAVIEKMTDNRSLVNSVYEEEETLLNPQNMIFEYKGRIYIISVAVLLKQLLSVILTLILIYGVSRFLYKQKL